MSRELRIVLIGAGVLVVGGFIVSGFNDWKKLKKLSKAHRRNEKKYKKRGEYIQKWTSGDVIINGEIFRDFAGAMTHSTTIEGKRLSVLPKALRTLHLTTDQKDIPSHDSIAFGLIGAFPLEIGEVLFESKTLEDQTIKEIHDFIFMCLPEETVQIVEKLIAKQQ